MASSSQTSPLFFVLFLLAFPLQSLYGNSEDFKNWGNIQHHHGKAAVGLESSHGSVQSFDSTALDPELREAEERSITLIVSRDGYGDFKSISEALLHAVPDNNTRRVVLDIRPGLYREKISVVQSQRFVTFLGDPLDPPIIMWNDTAADVDQGKLLGASGSATVIIRADYFIASNIIFMNVASHTSDGKPIGAVAVRVSGDKAAFHHCGFYGFQNTLYDHKGMHYFNNCTIEGAADVIFGVGRSLYENCYMSYIGEDVSALTVHGGSLNTMDTGFSFVNCEVTGTTYGNMYLGRAAADHARVIFSKTFLDSVVKPEGWHDGGAPKRQKTVFFGEHKCYGPGADLTGRVPWSRSLSDDEAMAFTGIDFVEGKRWIIPI